MMKISVIIPSVRSSTVNTTITSILRQTWKDWELIVVGQGSSDDVRAIAEAAADDDQRVKYLHINEYGISRARNAGIASTDSDVVAFTDDDCEAQEDWLETISHYFCDYLEVGMVGGSVIAPPKPHFGLAMCPAIIPTESLYDPVGSSHQPPTGWDWIGANIAFRRSVIEINGPFDEFLGAGSPHFPSGEDTDYKLRMEDSGTKMITTPRSVVYHTYGQRFGLKAMLNISRNYACGSGGMAGKLTLQGDIRGQEWVRNNQRQVLSSIWRRPYRIPVDWRRLYHHIKSYYYCLNSYEVEGGLLKPINAGST